MTDAEPIADTEPEFDKDMTSADVGLVHATSLEVGPLLSWCDRKRRYDTHGLSFIGGFFGDLRVAFCRCGMGPESAARATGLLIDAHRPKFIISTGFSGSLSPELRLNDIVHADSVLEEGGEPQALKPSMAADLSARVHVGRLLTVPRMIRTVAEKTSLGLATGALAVDMESAAVERIARERKTPFVAFRVISDDLSKDLPPEVLSIVGATGSVRLGAALAAIFKRPASVLDLWTLREQANAAADRLSKFLGAILKQVRVD